MSVITTKNIFVIDLTELFSYMRTIEATEVVENSIPLNRLISNLTRHTMLLFKVPIAHSLERSKRVIHAILPKLTLEPSTLDAFIDTLLVRLNIVLLQATNGSEGVCEFMRRLDGNTYIFSILPIEPIYKDIYPCTQETLYF